MKLIPSNGGLCHTNPGRNQEKPIRAHQNLRSSYGKDVQITNDPERIVQIWLNPTENANSCSDILVDKYTLQNNIQWRPKPVTLKCKEKTTKCSKQVATICVPKCCPHNKILDIKNNSGQLNYKCIDAYKHSGPTQSIHIPIRNSTKFECSNPESFKELR